MTYRAQTVVTMDGPPIDDGAVAVEGDRIEAVGPLRRNTGAGGSVTDLGEVVLLPGLINAHCHLDFTSLRGVIPPQRSFADWIRQINGLRRELSDDDYPRVDRGWIGGGETLGHDHDRECRVDARASQRECRRLPCEPGGLRS